MSPSSRGAVTEREGAPVGELRGTPPRVGRLWAWAPALLLGGLLGAQLIVLTRVLHDPSFALEPDYYQKAVSWDEERARERQSRALGFQATASVRAAASGATLLLWLVNAQGEPVTGARLNVTAFHNARAAEVFTLSAREVSPGEYVAELGSSRPGAWELRVTARRAEEYFERTLRVELSPLESKL